MGSRPRLRSATFPSSMSTHVTRCPRCARQAPVTSPTYPVPTTPTLRLSAKTRLQTCPVRPRRNLQATKSPTSCVECLNKTGYTPARSSANDSRGCHLGKLRSGITGPPFTRPEGGVLRKLVVLLVVLAMMLLLAAPAFALEDLSVLTWGGNCVVN